MSNYEHLLPNHEMRLWEPAPTLGSSQTPVNPAARALMSSPGRRGCWTVGALTLTQT